MIKSQFILDILDLLLDGDRKSEFVKNQLPYLSDSEYNYTNGAGCFIYFLHIEEIIKYKTRESFILNGVKIESEELEIGADATLFMKDGIIDHLEIWSFDNSYPNTELRKYTLTQDWIGSPKRVIER